MDGSQMRDIRLRMGLNQQELADALGQHRLTVVQYERGFRHKDQKPVEIPKVVELACLSLWAGMRSYREIFIEKTSLEPRLISAALVSQENKEASIRALQRQGIDVGKEVLFFPWNQMKFLWPEMQEWCKEVDVSAKMHPVFNVDKVGEGIAVVEFSSKAELGYFHLRWTPDVPEAYNSDS